MAKKMKPLDCKSFVSQLALLLETVGRASIAENQTIIELLAEQAMTSKEIRKGLKRLREVKPAAKLMKALTNLLETDPRFKDQLKDALSKKRKSPEGPDLG